MRRLRERLRESERRNEALQSENASLQSQIASLRAEFGSFRRDYEALAEATRAMTGERDLLQKRVAELEVVNKRLVDMLWGRRSERRSDSPDQMQLAFAAEPPDVAEQEIITAQAKADEATDLELLRRLEARRKARREKRQVRNEEFPPDIERRERTIDLTEEEKKGLKRIGEKITERMRFEKPHVYVDVIIRPEYVVAGEPEAGVRSAPPPLSIIEGCKYDFSVIAAIARHEVRVPHADVSPAGLVWPVRLVPEPFDRQRSGQLRRGDDWPARSADVASVVAAEDSLGRRHAAVACCCEGR